MNKLKTFQKNQLQSNNFIESKTKHEQLHLIQNSKLETLVRTKQTNVN